MKIREILLGIALTLGCSACNDWLTVQPETVVLKEDACGTDAGVKQVLSGMYYTMRSILYNPEGALGGGSGLSESLACTWYATGERAIALANHDYHASDGVESVLNMTFRTFYDVIAMANDLVEGVEKNKDRLSTSVYNIGMGEALAIRALCHLDLIRLWGPMPAYVDASKKYLPYVTVNSTANYEYLTYDKYMGLLLEDLNRAEEFLQKSDPVVTGTFESTEMSNAEWSYRKSRINYYGVLGLQARARLWFGDKEGALNYARMVIDAKNEDGTQKVRLTNGTDDFPAISTTFPWLRNWNACGTYYSEHLCGIKCDVEGYYSVEDYNSSWNKRGVSLVIDRDVNKQAWEELYNENVDIRYVLWQRDANAAYAQKVGYITRKYEYFYNGTAYQRNFPIVRLAEMYLIILENAPLNEANEALKVFSEARCIEYKAYTETDREQRVYKEWLRELIAEGQNFFTYKRYGEERMLFSSSDISYEQYVLPLPEKEYINNNGEKR